MKKSVPLKSRKAKTIARRRTVFTQHFSLHGYDVALSVPAPKLTAADLKALLGTHAIEPSTRPPVITAQLIDDANDFEEGGSLYTPELMLGDGFALNYETRTIYFPRHSPRLLHMKNLGDQNPFTRTVIFCIAILAEHNGLETVARKETKFQAPLYLHASSVLTPKGALVFCGECTFGKTTISTKLLKEFPLLEDDQVTILISTGEKKSVAPRVICFGDSRKNAKPIKDTIVPLKGIFWLKKDPENAIEKMEQAEAAALMLGPMVDWKNPVAIKQRLRLFKALFEAVPCQRLAFKKESAPLVEFLRAKGIFKKIRFQVSG